MAAKDGPALFELMRKKRAAEGEAPATPTPEADSQPCESQPGEPARAPEAQSEPTAAAEPGPTEPIPLLELAGEHLRISLTSVSAAVALGLLLVLLAVAYEVGHGAGWDAGFVEGQASFEASTASEIEAAASRPAEPELVEELLLTPVDESPAEEAGEAAGVPVLTDAYGAPFVQVPGDTYVVVQEFRTGDLEDARLAQEFLRLREVNTALVAGPAGTWRLLSTQGHNYRDPAQKEQGQELLSRIRAIGEQYRAAGGRYGLQGYPKTYTGSDE